MSRLRHDGIFFLPPSDQLILNVMSFVLDAFSFLYVLLFFPDLGFPAPLTPLPFIIINNVSLLLAFRQNLLSLSCPAGCEAWPYPQHLDAFINGIQICHTDILQTAKPMDFHHVIFIVLFFSLMMISPLFCCLFEKAGKCWGLSLASFQPMPAVT